MDLTTLKLGDLKPHAIGALIAILLLVGGFAIGRFATPTKTEIKQTTTTQVVTKVDDTKLDQLIEQNHQFQSQLAELKKSIHREKWAVTHADGSKEEKQTEDINVDRTVQTTQIQYVDRVETKTETKYIDRVVDKIVEKDKLIESPQPRWEIDALAAVSGPDLKKPQTWLNGPIAYGGAVKYRLIGPFSIGAFGLTNLTFGIQLGLAF